MYAVVFTYSFDTDSAAYLFDNYDKAIAWLRASWEEEKRIDTEENGWDIDASISDDGQYAKIITYFPDDECTTEFYLSTIYSRK